MVSLVWLHVEGKRVVKILRQCIPKKHVFRMKVGKRQREREIEIDHRSPFSTTLWKANRLPDQESAWAGKKESCCRDAKYRPYSLTCCYQESAQYIDNMLDV